MKIIILFFVCFLLFSCSNRERVNLSGNSIEIEATENTEESVIFSEIPANQNLLETAHIEDIGIDEQVILQKPPVARFVAAGYEIEVINIEETPTVEIGVQEVILHTNRFGTQTFAKEIFYDMDEERNLVFPHIWRGTDIFNTGAIIIDFAQDGGATGMIQYSRRYYESENKIISEWLRWDIHEDYFVVDDFGEVTISESTIIRRSQIRFNVIFRRADQDE